MALPVIADPPEPISWTAGAAPGAGEPGAGAAIAPGPPLMSTIISFMATERSRSMFALDAAGSCLSHAVMSAELFPLAMQAT